MSEPTVDPIQATSTAVAERRPVATTPAGALTLQFLAWVARGPRTLVEVMEAWRTSCPRLSVWEDAVSDGLVRIVRADGKPTSMVVLTDSGRAALH